MRLLNDVLSGLSMSQMARVSPFLSEIQLAAGQSVHEPGQRVDAVYFPSDAVLSVVTVMLDGRSVEAATIGNESVAGVVSALAGVPAHARTFAQIAGGALKMPAWALAEQVSADATLLKSFLGHVHKDIAQAEQSVACNAIHSATERLARWLLLSQDRVGSSRIALTQEYLSIMLGVQRTTVTSVAQYLRSKGLIIYTRGRIDILDREGLEHAACECYAVNKRAEADAQDLARALAQA